MIKKLTFFILLLFLLSFGNAQSISPQTTNMSGGSINTGYYQLEWSVGELAVIESFFQPNAILTNGVLQPLTDKPFTQNTNTSWGADEIRIFPVPTNGKFELDLLSRQQGLLTIQLMDGMGQVLQRIEKYYFGFGLIERFDITRLASASYYLKVSLSPFPGFTKKDGGFVVLKVN